MQESEGKAEATHQPEDQHAKTGGATESDLEALWGGRGVVPGVRAPDGADGVAVEDEAPEVHQ
eukprot:58959-Rhodomonas_salina.1